MVIVGIVMLERAPDLEPAKAAWALVEAGVGVVAVEALLSDEFRRVERLVRLASSREPLGLRAERVYAVRAMDVEKSLQCGLPIFTSVWTVRCCHGTDVLEAGDHVTEWSASGGLDSLARFARPPRTCRRLRDPAPESPEALRVGPGSAGGHSG